MRIVFLTTALLHFMNSLLITICIVKTDASISVAQTKENILVLHNNMTSLNLLAIY
jgi:hypothetical protein